MQKTIPDHLLKNTYGNGQSYIVINDKPEKKSTAGNLSKDCIKILTEYRNVTLTHDEVRNKVLGSQNKLNQINVTIENMLRQINDPRTGKLLHMAASLIPLLRAARHARDIISVVGDLLGDLLDISALYSPIREQRILLAKEHREFIFLYKKMGELRKQKEGLYRKYNNMNCKK